MKKDFYLIVNSNGTTKTTKNRPGLNWNEIAIKVKLEIPDMLFQKPQLHASIVVPESAASPKEVDVDVQDNIKNAIEAATGLEVRISIEDQEATHE